LIIKVSDTAKLWEVIPVIQIVQAVQDNIKVVCNNVDSRALLSQGNVWLTSEDPTHTIDFNSAYRDIETSKLTYPEIIRNQLYLREQLDRPKLFGYEPSEQPHIVLCPFALRKDLNLPANMWRSILRMLRSYIPTVYAMGGAEDRLDELPLTEGDYRCVSPLDDKLELLATATFIVGVPNEWTWLSTAWMKRMLLYLPDDQPFFRWFPFPQREFGRLYYQPQLLQIPTLLAGTRKLIQRL
jgi:hypothetical protein